MSETIQDSIEELRRYFGSDQVLQIETHPVDLIASKPIQLISTVEYKLIQ